MMTPPAVLFIDDDHRLVEQYARAVEARGLRAHRTFGVDEALRLLRAGLSPDAIVWDMMLVPGEAFAEEETESGLSTGRFLYPELRLLSPSALFVLLTNDATSIDAYERPNERSFGRAKRYTSARHLAAFLAQQLGVPRVRASASQSAPRTRPVASKTRPKAESPGPAGTEPRQRPVGPEDAPPSPKRQRVTRAQKPIAKRRAQQSGKG